MLFRSYQYPAEAAGSHIDRIIPYIKPELLTVEFKRPLLRLIVRGLNNWLLRHQNAFNYWIHLPGIALLFFGLTVLVFMPLWGLTAISLGYFLQWIGHKAEGNDVGEWAAIKRWLGWPYVSVAPQYDLNEYPRSTE